MPSAPHGTVRGLILPAQHPVAQQRPGGDADREDREKQRHHRLLGAEDKRAT